MLNYLNKMKTFIIFLTIQYHVIIFLTIRYSRLPY